MMTYQRHNIIPLLKVTALGVLVSSVLVLSGTVFGQSAANEGGEAATQNESQDATTAPTLVDLGEITTEKIDVSGVDGDFVLGPGKTDVAVEAGETRRVNLMVTNRMGEEKTFEISVRDFVGTKDTERTVKIVESGRSPYTLRDYLKLPRNQFTLQHGERATIPVTVHIPADSEPGGRYGSVLVSTVTREGSGRGAGQAPIVTRLASLFFVTVPGDITREGGLEEFAVKNDQGFFTEGPIPFTILYRNTGNVHVNPYGEIRVENIFGQEIGRREIEPWFAMPNSLRLREVSWDSGFMIGRYTAHLALNRGYDNQVEHATVSFWVIPWKILLAIFAGLLGIFFAVRWVFSRVEINVKKKDGVNR